ncbi:MAG: hypothetical protein L6Q37_08055 [Bdellovibrionaceae bacterium]|nr:hypothetical protein [Pseudobdellovibrionaceae bacterium]NUM60269.1 hypothetical protein [Pseudobdellovibrionaceae bacterium]
MSQNKIRALEIPQETKNYLYFLKNTYGIQSFSLFLEQDSVAQSLASETASAVITNKDPIKTKKIFWKKRTETSSTVAKLRVIHQITSDGEGLLGGAMEDTFIKMLASLGVNLGEVELWETNEQQSAAFYEFLLEHPGSGSILLLLNQPTKDNNLYEFQKQQILETFSPMLFEEQPELKKTVWSHFKILLKKGFL